MLHSMNMLLNRWKTPASVLFTVATTGFVMRDAMTRDESKMTCTTSPSYIPGVGPYPYMKSCVPKEVAEALTKPRPNV